MTVHAASIPFPTLAPAVDEWRERTCIAKPSHGVPPHVTLLIPVPNESALIERTLASFEPFDVVFARFGRFDEVLWLAPEPVEQFVAMTCALMDAFPGHPPYGGGFDEIVPHLTVAEADLDAAEAQLASSLPISARAETVSIFEQTDPPEWRVTASFAL